MSGIEPMIIASAIQAGGGIAQSAMQDAPGGGGQVTDPAQAKQAQMGQLLSMLQQSQQQPPSGPPQGMGGPGQQNIGGQPDLFSFLRSIGMV